MHLRRIATIAGVAAARAIVVLVLGLGFWAAAPIVAGWHPTTVMTASMSPAIEVGDVVVARPVSLDQMVPGRVLLGEDPDWPGRLRLHRVSEVSADGALITRGDANPSVDTSPIRPEAVHGVGVLRVPWIGLPIVWLRTGQVLPLATTMAAFVLCLSIALRQGADDEPADPPGASVDVSAPADAPQTRRMRRALGVVSTVALTTTLAATPAWAALGDTAWTPARVEAGRVTAPLSLGCSNDGGAVVTWAYDGWEPRSFDLLVDGQVVARDLSPWARSARVPQDRFYSVFRSSTVTVRANVGGQWSADSSASVSVGGALFGFGRPFCR